MKQAGFATEQYATRVTSDLLYAERYFASPAYLRLQGKPALFVFPYGDVDPHLDWALIRGALTAPVTLISKDPDPTNPAHDQQFDGFYAWVQPSDGQWATDGKEWGAKYLRGFYSTMRDPVYRNKVAVGGVWPGFDDSLAPWKGINRFISRQGQRVWDKAWHRAEKFHARIVMIATWNDFEEGTDVEFGVPMGIDMEAATPEVLLRSSPLQVTWDQTRGDGILQIYRDGTLIYDQRHSSGVFLSLASERTYEVKVWMPDCPTPLVKAVKIRCQDPIPRVTPIAVE